MPKRSIVKISKDGFMVSGIYSDCLQGLGEMTVTRASHVEFNDILKKWTVEFTLGLYKNACLLQTFDKRSDALHAEVEELSRQQLLNYL